MTTPLPPFTNSIPFTAGPAEWRYGLDPEFVQRGWPWALERMARVESLGIRSHILHMPFGSVPGVDGGFTFDAGLAVGMDADPRYRRLMDSFAASIRPTVKRGVRVLVYLGGLQLSPALLAMKVPGRYDDWVRRVVACVKPLLDAGCDLGVDASSGLPADSLEYAGLMLLRRMFEGQGGKVWIEARPPDNLPHLHGWPTICRDDFWRVYGPVNGAAERAKLGPVTRWLVYGGKDGEEPAKYAARVAASFPVDARLVVADRCTPATDVLSLLSVVPGALLPAATNN